MAFGTYGLKALEPGWITARQIEASRIVISRIVRKVGKMGLEYSPTNLLQLNQLKQGWVKVWFIRSLGFSNCQAEFYLKLKVLIEKWLKLLLECRSQLPIKLNWLKGGQFNHVENKKLQAIMNYILNLLIVRILSKSSISKVNAKLEDLSQIKN